MYTLASIHLFIDRDRCHICLFMRLSWWLSSKRLPLWLSWQRIRLQCRRPGFDPWVGKIPWRRKRLPTPLFWPGEFHGLYSPRGPKELDTTEQLSLSLFFSSKESACNAGENRRHGLDLWVGKIPWRKAWQPTPIFLCGEFHKLGSLAVHRVGH